MYKDPSTYNAKLEQKYFYLPKICRKSNNTKDLYKSTSVRFIPIFTIILTTQSELIFDNIFTVDDKIAKSQKEINKIKEDSISTMIFENKKIPETWTRKSSYLKILKKIFKNNDEIVKVAVSNTKNNEQREIYNQKLKENLPLLNSQYTVGNTFEYDNDLITLVNSRKKMKNLIKVPKIRSLNEEFKDMMKRQNNKKIVISRPDSIKQNLNNILNYRKNIALRFKYNRIKLKNEFNSQLTKSKSQILNSVNRSKQMLFNKNLFNLDLVGENAGNVYKKDYEDKLMITGMNNKKYKNVDENKIIEEYSENNYQNYKYNIKSKKEMLK